MERIATGAGALRIGIVDGEALLLDGVGVVDHGTTQIRGAVIVTGCLAERYREEILKEIPEVDAVVGIHQVVGQA